MQQLRLCVITPDQWLVDKEEVNHRRIVEGEAKKGMGRETVISGIRLFARDLISAISPMGLGQLGSKGHATSEDTRATELQSNIEVDYRKVQANYPPHEPVRASCSKTQIGIGRLRIPKAPA